MSNEISRAYFHISNGGVNFTFLDDPERGPMIEIISHHLGNNTIVQQLHVDAESLTVLAGAVQMAVEHEYQYSPAANAASVPRVAS